MPEKPKNTPEEMKKEENINYLKNFWEWNDENDKKLMSNPEGGKLMKESILENVNKKLSWVNDIKAQEAISALKDWLNNIHDGPLNEEDALRLKNIYNKINNIEAQEIEQNNKSWKEVQQNREEREKEYKDSLDMAVEKIREILKNHEEEAKKKVEDDIKKWREISAIPNEIPPDPIENWPDEI